MYPRSPMPQVRAHLRRIAPRLLLIAGALTTIATSLNDATRSDSAQVALDPGTTHRVTLHMARVFPDTADDILLTFRAAGPGRMIRIVPDDPQLDMRELDTSTTVDTTYENLQERCGTADPCQLGFSVELLAGDLVDITVEALAAKWDRGGCSRVPSDFPATAAFELAVASP
jgi:hypothetical protein